jgi:hypothetical protein
MKLQKGGRNRWAVGVGHLSRGFGRRSISEWRSSRRFVFANGAPLFERAAGWFNNGTANNC